ncbi:hypothetical protein [Nocardia abscessus]|uniref:hypothetical protein n=1 Tax=Nocardia abscessus TaxID=120957 RepID=UPI0024538C50|nr:hypothetical protein [Nocardia abscessus]
MTQPSRDTNSPAIDGLLSRVIDFYLSSRDFNGLYFHRESPGNVAEAIQLIEAGQIQAVSSDDYLNIHIRPWPSRRSVENQIDDVRTAPDADFGICLYPTAAAMADYNLGGMHADQPYSLQMAKGRGTLELAYFRFDVLEPYRNDPRFDFRFTDFGANVSISNEVYLDDNEADDDKISIGHIGFAYDLSQYDENDPNSTIVRRVCAFFCDLSKLSSTHQQRWRTYQVPDAPNLKPHPIWFRQQMGHWPDGLGPFERLFFELRTWNELHQRAFDEDLLRVTERPTGLGWILRASQTEYDSFVHELDKLLSDNIRHKALDSLGAAKKNENGDPLGTLARLDDALTKLHADEDGRKHVLKPLKEVRRLRQRPAHGVNTNITDSTFIHRQAALLQQVTEAVENLRHFWQTHPKNRDWEEPDYVRSDAKRYWL